MHIGRSGSVLELRMANGTALHTQAFSHAQVVPDAPYPTRRTLTVSPVPGGRQCRLWLNGSLAGALLLPIVGDIYGAQQQPGGLFGSVWGWVFSGALHSIAVAAIGAADAASPDGRAVIVMGGGGGGDRQQSSSTAATGRKYAALSTLLQKYLHATQVPSDINEHIATLRRLAENATHITEFGVRR